MVTLSELKSFLGITVSTYDSLLTTYIAMISAQVEKYCENKFNGVTTFTNQSLPMFDEFLVIDLEAFPVSSVSLTYDGTSLTNEEDYEVDLAAGQIIFPTTPYPTFSKYKVTYTCGYAVANVPQDLKLAVMSIIKSLFESNAPSQQGNSNVKSKKIGDFNVTYGDGGAGGNVGGVINQAILDNAAILDRYKRISI